MLQNRNFFPGMLFAFLLTGCTENIPAVSDTETESMETTEITTQSDTLPIPTETEPLTETELLIETEPSTETEPLTEPVTTEETTPPVPDQIILKGMETLEVHQEITIGEFITNTNVLLQNPETPIDTSQIGVLEISVAYQYGTEIREEVLSYSVQDTTPPVILNDGTNAFIRTGEEFDLRNLIGYGDNEDSAPSLTYEGDVDTSIPGDYMLIAYLTDRSGNQSSCRLTVTVADEEPDLTGSQQQINFPDFISQYNDPERQTAFGIDVSKWQGYINYDAVKQAGCEFVLLRIGYSYGEPELDEYYLYNIDAAKQAGLRVGVYFYTTDTTEAQIRADADWIVEKLDGRILDMPIAFDWEDFQNFQKYGITLYDLNQLWKAFSDELNQHNYESMLYGSKYFLENVWGSPEDSPVWLAHYAENTDYQGNYMLWQRTSAGIISGVDVPVDFNILYQNESVKETGS